MRTIYLFILLLCALSGYAQQFDNYFEDKTLRLDYIFAGNSSEQHAFLSEIIALDKWHGRVENLSVTPIQGYGQVKVFDQQTNELIYILPFGSLFQEWLTLEEAKTIDKSFENSFLIPFPKQKVVVQISFFNDQQQEQIVLKHEIDPKDILIRKVFDVKNDYEIIHQSKIKHPIKIALVAEGYTADEMDLFMQYAHKTVDYLFEHQVFKKYADYFEIAAVKTISVDSGISIPSKKQWLNTALQSNFDTFYSERYLTTLHMKLLHNQLENIPYQHIIILANTDFYGGGGILNSYSLTTTKNKEFAPVVVHEFGHSFAGLADEYFYENDVFENAATLGVEPWEKNISSLVDFSSKWKTLVVDETPIPTPHSIHKQVNIGAFEGLPGNGLYIPTLNCRMKANHPKDFCVVCSAAIEEMILFYTTNQKK